MGKRKLELWELPDSDIYVAKCLGGYNVHRREATRLPRGGAEMVLVYECLHLHPTYREAEACLASFTESKP